METTTLQPGPDTIGSFIRLTHNGLSVTWTVVQGPHIFLKASVPRFQTRLGDALLLDGVMLEIHDVRWPSLVGQPVLFTYKGITKEGIYI